MELKITSSNIRFENPADGDHDWPHRKNILRDILLNFNCDILGTQEGREPQLRALNELIPKYELIDHHRQWIDERMYPCIFIKPDIIKVLRSGDIWLSETPEISGSKSFDSAFPRLCTWIEAQDVKTLTPFFFVNTHLDHVKQETRIEQAKVLSKEIKKENKKNLPIILMGDFNDSPESPIRKIVNDLLKLHDPWIEHKKIEESSHHSFHGEKGDGIRIDWILLSHDFSCDDIFLDKTHQEKIYPSDHFPLMANIRLY